MRIIYPSPQKVYILFIYPEGIGNVHLRANPVCNDYMQVAPPDADADADAADADADAADALAEFPGGIDFSENKLSMFWMDVKDV